MQTHKDLQPAQDPENPIVPSSDGLSVEVASDTDGRESVVDPREDSEYVADLIDLEEAKDVRLEECRRRNGRINTHLDFAA